MTILPSNLHPVHLMKYNEPLKFLPTFYTTFTAMTRCFTLAQVRTAFGFSTPILPFFFLVCYFLPFAFEIYYSFLMRCFKPRGECTLAEYIDSILSVRSKISYIWRFGTLPVYRSKRRIFRPPFVLN